jgi:hypothetical protein
LRRIVIHDDYGVGEESVSPLIAKRPKQVLEKCRSLVGADADRDVGSFVALRLPQHFRRLTRSRQLTATHFSSTFAGVYA